MWRSLGNWFRSVQLWRYRRSLSQALALQNRNEVREDGLALERISCRLEVSWYARDVHPRDCDLSGQQWEVAFNQQAMEDTETAIRRLFERRPEVEVIEVTVLQPDSKALLGSGVVQRAALKEKPRSQSARMRLGNLGINYKWRTADRTSGHREPTNKASSMAIDEA